jgi:hypothetical protein
MTYDLTHSLPGGHHLSFTNLYRYHLVLFFFFPLRFFFHDALPILLHVQMPFSPEGMTEKREGGEGKAGARCTYTFRRSYQINQCSKKEKMRQSCPVESKALGNQDIQSLGRFV